MSVYALYISNVVLGLGKWARFCWLGTEEGLALNPTLLRWVVAATGLDVAKMNGSVLTPGQEDVSALNAENFLEMD